MNGLSAVILVIIKFISICNLIIINVYKRVKRELGDLDDTWAILFSSHLTSFMNKYDVIRTLLMTQ
jgi:hypothetical protein